MKRSQLIFTVANLLIAIQIYPVNSQSVSTFLTGNGLNGPDGFALDSAQNLYAANWGGGAGTTVLKITPDTLVSTFDSTSNAPDGLIFDASGNLYISNYNSGIIHKISPEGIKTQFASGLINPSALALDDAGNLYVSNYGSTTVSRITPDGTVSTFASGFSGPLGLVFDPSGNLYVSNYNTGIIHKVTPDGTISVFATVPNGSTSRIQYLVRGQSGNLYLPSYGHHKIYRISSSGDVNVYAGTGVPGSTDGPLDSAQFNGPNSIVLTNQGDLYISEYNANRIRKITGVEFPVGVKPGSESLIPVHDALRIFPNPFSSETNIIIESGNQPGVKVILSDPAGKTFNSTALKNVPTGLHHIVFDGSGLATGTYFCTLLAGGHVICSQKMICVK